jgi:hypothetical protein
MFARHFIGHAVISLFTHQAETIRFVSSGHMNAIVLHNGSQPPLFISLPPSSIQISAPQHQHQRVPINVSFDTNSITSSIHRLHTTTATASHMKGYTSKMDSQFKLPRHVRQPISNSAPHTSQFQELLMEAAPNRGEEGYARSWLEKNGVLRKRKRADDDEALSNDHKRASSMSTSDFRKPLHSTTPTKALSTPEFKRPQPLQRERLYALQSRLANEEQASKGTPSKKSRIESQPASPKTPTTNLARPSPSSSTTLASGKPLSALSSNLSRASHQIPAMQRAEHTPTPISRTPKYKPRDSSLSVTGARDRSTSGKSQVSEPQRSIFKLPNQSSTVEGSRRGRTSNSTREQVNSNRSRFTNNANFHVPTIDR